MRTLTDAERNTTFAGLIVALDDLVEGDQAALRGLLLHVEEVITEQRGGLMVLVRMVMEAEFERGAPIPADIRQRVLTALDSVLPMIEGHDPAPTIKRAERMH